MEKTIKLRSSYGLYEDRNSIVIDDDDLKITLDYELAKNTKMFFIADNGLESVKGEVVNKQFVLPNNFIRPGNIAITLELVAQEKTVKRYKVEDLLVRELEGQIITIPQVEDIDIRLKNIERRVDAIENKLDFFIKIWKEEL